MIAPNGNSPIEVYHQNEMIKEVEKKYVEILQILNFDLENHNIKDTPKRIAKMMVKELFSGCYTKEPTITVFPNEQKFDQMITIGPISVKSVCAHHFLSFFGEAYISYIPKNKIVGLSKFSRIVEWFSRRPQIQEELTEQISSYIQNNLDPVGCGVYITSKHSCMSMRGVNENNSFMDTCSLKGAFMETGTKQEFLKFIEMKRR